MIEMKTRIPINIFLVIALFVSTSFFIPTALSIPTNKEQCNSCHGVGGQGTLLVTNIDGSRPENNIFVIEKGETITISLQGNGTNEESEPGVALIFDPLIHHQINIEGASPGGEGSYAFYVKDGDENDKDPNSGNVKGIFQISVNVTGDPGNYNTAAIFIQEEQGITVRFNLIIEGVSRGTSSISIFVSPSVVYANRDEVFISGTIRPKDVDQLSIVYKTENLWQILESISPTPDGLFFYTWQPEKIKDYSIKVQFEGDEKYAPIESDIFDIKVLKSSQTLNSEILTSVMLAMGVMFTFLVLFFGAGRSRYNKRITIKDNIK